MTLTKSDNNFNISGIQKILIIKDVFITSVPKGNSINQSELTYANEKVFSELEITDGNYSIVESDKGHGSIYTVNANFRHPKVRLEADNVLSAYKGKRVRLVIIDNNGEQRLTPPGKLKIKESNPAIGGYNGYNFSLKALGECVPYITLDGYPEPPFDLWDHVVKLSMGPGFNAIVNQPFSLYIKIQNDRSEERHVTIIYNDEYEEITLAPDETLTIERNYNATEASFIIIYPGTFRDGDRDYEDGIYYSELKMKDAGITRLLYRVKPSTKMDLSNNTIIEEDINYFLEHYRGDIWEGNNPEDPYYLYLNGMTKFGYNAIPTSQAALDMAEMMNEFIPDGLRLNS